MVVLEVKSAIVFFWHSAAHQVRVMETLEGGKLVTRHWVSWNKEDGQEVSRANTCTDAHTHAQTHTHTYAHTYAHT